MSVLLIAFAEGLEILLGLLATAIGQTVARERVSRFGGALGHFLFDSLGHVALHVRTFDQAAECCRAAAIVLVHLGFARVGVAPFFRAIADACPLPHSFAGLAIIVFAAVHSKHVALAFFAPFAVAVFADHRVLGHFHLVQHGVKRFHLVHFFLHCSELL